MADLADRIPVDRIPRKDFKESKLGGDRAIAACMAGDAEATWRRSTRPSARRRSM
jgi:hypothetical protein